MKRWKILSDLRFKNKDLRMEDILKTLLRNRTIERKSEIDEFLNPKLENLTVKSVGIDKRELNKAVSRIKRAIEDKEQIVIYGDYDVDGICGTAILWETLHSLGAKVMPYIPHRIEDGYGLSVKGIQNVISVIPNLFRDLGSSGNKILNQVQDDNDKGIKLIITVDNGIVANKAVEFANKEGIDVIVTDHHVPSNPSTGSGLPDAFSIVHTTKLCGAGVAWALAQEFKVQSSKFKVSDNHLELVALATIADLVSLVGPNRTLVRFGLEKLRETKRVGLLELFKEGGLDKSKIGVYEVGHIIAPRLNAMGRLEYAMDSLRLLCTKNQSRAKILAEVLGRTNRERQELTIETVERAKSKIKNQKSKIQFKTQNLLFIGDVSYQQGIIGLVAGKLVEEFYRPSIVVSVGEKYSKASARSVNGFNIIEFIRSSSEMLVDAGGHSMAAGFTVETEKLTLLQKTLEEKAEKLLDEEILTRTLRVDCEMPLFSIDNNLYGEIQKLAPFGIGNPEPTFMSKDVVIEDMRGVGADGKHIKFVFSCHPEFISGSNINKGEEKMLKQVQHDKKQVRNDIAIGGIAFGMGERANEFHIGDKADIAYTIDLNVWNGNSSLQLKVKDIKRRETQPLE